MVSRAHSNPPFQLHSSQMKLCLSILESLDSSQLLKQLCCLIISAAMSASSDTALRPTPGQELPCGADISSQLQ